MNQYQFNKITPVNGFDSNDPDNAMQNNYAWSMAEFGGYIYVGTGRNIPISAMAGMGISIPPELAPENETDQAEIWRYPIYGGCKKWERVYKASKNSGIMGFRYMITYTDDHCVSALYCAAFGRSNNLLMTTNGCDFEEIESGLPIGFSTRTMIVYKNKLYSGATNALDYSPTSYLYVTENPQKGWEQVDFGQGHIPTGEIVSMEVFNDQLYIGTSPAGGFEVWKNHNPECGKWKLVVDKGAGDALNELPMSMEVFEDHLYVGTGIWYGFQSVDPDKTIVPPKGFDVIRINKRDKWEVVVGGTPIAPTKPTTGKRNRAKYASGFGNMFNAYCWQIFAYNDKLYIGTWDSAILYYSVLRNSIINGNENESIIDDFFADNNLSENNLLKMLSQIPLAIKGEYNWIAWIFALLRSIPRYPCQFGFDLFVSDDGDDYRPITLAGFNNPKNYGLRTSVITNDKKQLFVGTANPYEGCEVWHLK